MPTAKDQALQEPLVHYAGIDAYVGIMLFEILDEALLELPVCLEVGKAVVVFDTSGRKRLAYGTVRGDGETQDDVSVEVIPCFSCFSSFASEGVSLCLECF